MKVLNCDGNTSSAAYKLIYTVLLNYSKSNQMQTYFILAQNFCKDFSSLWKENFILIVIFTLRFTNKKDLTVETNFKENLFLYPDIFWVSLNQQTVLNQKLDSWNLACVLQTVHSCDSIDVKLYLATMNK